MALSCPARCRQALFGAVRHRTVLPGITRCCQAPRSAARHPTVPLGIVWDRTWHRAVPLGNAPRVRARQRPVLATLARCHRAVPGAVRLPRYPRPLSPRCGQRRLCRQQRIVLGARSPCPADGRYNKAACCGQANYLSNYDLPLNHMIFLQSCRQLKPG